MRIVLATYCLLLTASTFADTAHFTIIDDESQTSRVQAVANAWAASRSDNRFIDYVHLTVLIANEDGTWTRIGINQDELAYPASCVKLAFMAAGMKWSRENGHSYTYIDETANNAMSDMIVDSSNTATGVVVDIITGAPNNLSITSTNHPEWQPWYEARLYTENTFAGRGLLGNQTLLHKTYPSNSSIPGDLTPGAEGVALDFRGSNQMNPRLSASMMLEIVKEAIEPGATDIMRGMLRTDRWDDDSSIGFGLPPGTIYENKIGVTSNTLEDIAYIILPNGQELIMAIYTDAIDTSSPIPYDAADLGMLAEALILEFDWNAGGPWSRIYDDQDEEFFATDGWRSATGEEDKWGPTYHFAPGGADETAGWDLNAPRTGEYEIAVHYPEGGNRDIADFRVEHNGGVDIVEVDQTEVGGRWFLLGTYELDRGTGRVTLSSEDIRVNRRAIIDAVKVSKLPSPNDSASDAWVIE